MVVGKESQGLPALEVVLPDGAPGALRSQIRPHLVPLVRGEEVVPRPVRQPREPSMLGGSPCPTVVFGNWSLLQGNRSWSGRRQRSAGLGLPQEVGMALAQPDPPEYDERGDRPGVGRHFPEATTGRRVGWPQT